MNLDQIIHTARRLSRPYRITNGKKFRLADFDRAPQGFRTTEFAPDLDILRNGH